MLKGRKFQRVKKNGRFVFPMLKINQYILFSRGKENGKTHFDWISRDRWKE